MARFTRSPNGLIGNNRGRKGADGIPGGPPGPTGATGPAGAPGAGNQPVRATAPSNVSLSSPPSTMDGVALSNGDRILVRSQIVHPEQNGIYVYGATLVRAADANTWTSLVSAVVWVEEGSVNADTGWLCTVDQGGTLGTTPVAWTRIDVGGVAAGAGLSKSGVVLSAHADGVTIDTGGAGSSLRVLGGGITDNPTTTTLSSLTTGAETTRTITAPGKAAALYAVTVDQACRIRIYATAAQATADLARLQTADPTGNHGCLLEVLYTAAGTLNLSPEVLVVDQDSTRTFSFTANVRCDSGTTLNVTLAGLALVP